MIYLAHPYTHKDPAVMEARYLEAEAAMAQMLLDGHHIYSPIAMTHNAALRHNLPTESGWWRHHNYAMLRFASELWVLEMEGWEKSSGLNDEITLANHLRIPISQWYNHQGIWKKDESADRMRVFGSGEKCVQEKRA